MDKNKLFFYTGVFILTGIFITKMIWYSQRAIPYYEADIRNKTVGARLQMDGISPYFYHWKEGDSIRYYDCNAQPFKPSMTTSSPFQNKLFYPLANLEQKDINIIWLILLNVIFVTIILISLSFTKTKTQQYLVLLAGLLFFFSHGWKSNLKEGQSYILIPFTLLLFFYISNKSQNRITGFISGLIVMGLILFKPNTILFLIPFVLVITKNKSAFLKFFSLGVGLLLVINLFQRNEIKLWKDYFSSIKAHADIWQNSFTPVYSRPELLKEWEGINVASVKTIDSRYPLNNDKEISNFFVFYESQVKQKLPAWMLYTLFVLSSFFVLIVFYERTIKTGHNPIIEIFLCGSCIYMLSDFFSPIARFTYYSIQWVLPIMLTAAFYKPRHLLPLLLISIGLVLNIIKIESVKWEHVLGEIFIFCGVFIRAINPQPVKNYTFSIKSLQA